MIRQQIPNFFRLYLNPFVVQTCFCLSRYVRSTWFNGSPAAVPYQSFLANSFDEALSGAIKLARFSGSLECRSPLGLVIDRGGRLGPFAAVSIRGQGRIEFMPKLVVAGEDGRALDDFSRSGERFGFVVLVDDPASPWAQDAEALRALIREQRPLVITCLDRRGLNACRKDASRLLREMPPDIVVFDESFVNRQVPFAAFTARRSLYDHWNKPRLSTFHSTTFQPNTISSLHFMRCLLDADPEFYAEVHPELESIRQDLTVRAAHLGSLYSPSLARAIQTLGSGGGRVKAAGHYVIAGGRRIFDGVAGVACSIRGHNPETYVDEIEALEHVGDSHQAVVARLKELTSLGHVVPAVSGASAVENALRIGLTAQFPKSYVLAFQGGFGGKTLLALAGTANAFYKTHLDPLYENVIYIDPWSATVIEDIEAVLQKYPVAVVQLELIQAVGGIRALPPHVLDYLEANKTRWGYFLFVDEVQTGVYRTGPFIRSQALGITPDLLTIGKGTSDMMVPFALTLYSETVHGRLNERAPELPRAIRQKYDYEIGYKAVLNTLRRAEEMNLPSRVQEAAALFSGLLGEELASCKAVREVRVYGLLIAIELDTNRWPTRWFRKWASWLYLLHLARHPSFPVMIGFCQYEPNVLKLTPPLTISPAEVRRVCATIGTILNRSLPRLLPEAVGTLARSSLRRKSKRMENRS
jgi:acetylornithine/succinyldiaminopimelate/putrescine aminotransferase